MDPLLELIKLQTKERDKGYCGAIVFVYKKYNTEQQHCLHTWVTTGFPSSSFLTAYEGKQVNRTKTLTQTIDPTPNFIIHNKQSHPWHFICQAESNFDNTYWTKAGFLSNYVMLTNIFFIDKIKQNNNNNKVKLNEPNHMQTKTERGWRARGLPVH